MVNEAGYAETKHTHYDLPSIHPPRRKVVGPLFKDGSHALVIYPKGYECENHSFAKQPRCKPLLIRAKLIEKSVSGSQTTNIWHQHSPSGYAYKGIAKKTACCDKIQPAALLSEMLEARPHAPLFLTLILIG